MATPPSAWTGEKPRKAGNGAGRGSAARSGEKVIPLSPTGSAQDVHRTPPHSVEAEQGVLGSMLISPHETIAECVEKINEEYFYVPAHRTIYDVLVDLWNTRQGIDLITFTQVLRDRNLLDSVGGAAFVTNLFTFVPTAANVQYYLEIVRDKYILRQIISAATESVRRAYEEQEEVDSLLDEVEQKIFDVGEDRFKGQMLSMKDHAMQAIETIEKLYERKGSITGISTGFVEFDRMTSGLHPSEMVVIAARPSMGKCLAFDSTILLSDGSVATIEEIYQKRQASLLTLKENWKLDLTSPSDFVDDGLKPVWRITTRLGKVVKATLPHPFLTISGWTKLAELKVGDRIAVPRKLNVFGRRKWRECEVKLLAYLIGDGCLTGSNPRFTSGNPVVQKEFAAAVLEFGGLKTQLVDSGGTRTPSFRVASNRELIRQGRLNFGATLSKVIGSRGRSSRQIALAAGVSPASLHEWKRGNCVPIKQTFLSLCAVLESSPAILAPAGLEAISKSSRNSLTVWLDQLGIWGKGAHAKQIPAPVFTLVRPQLALFLNRLFATDGWATVLRDGQAQLGYATVSEKLARQVQHLLLRFGVVASLRKRSVKYNSTRRSAWQLDITDKLSIQTFIAEIGIFGKEKATEAVLRVLENRKYQTNRDLIPREIWASITKHKGSESWAALARRAEIKGHTNIHVGRRSPTRQRLAALATALKNAALRKLAESDVYWDEIVSIEPAGPEQVYDLTIPETHNFVANDICVHNTALAMNIAEYVAINEKLAVGVFSLEMSSQQLVQRMLCSRARVNLQRVRDGFLGERDFPSLTAAASKLAEARMFIDDSASLSILELRAKARRLKAQQDVSLIIVDYLQLLRSTTRRAQDNRQLEISEISAGLKALAKDLKIPVIVVAQLNRQPEQRSGGKPRLSDLRESGCLAGNTLITRADTGERIPIKTLAERKEQRPVKIWAVDSNLTMRVHDMVRVFASGRKLVYELRTRSGRKIKASGNHPFLRLQGWTQLAALRLGDHVAIPRHVHCICPSNPISDDEIVLLAHLLGDGCILPRQPYHYTSADSENLEAVRAAAERLFGIKGRLVRQKNWHHLYLPSPRRLTHSKIHPITAWFNHLGLERCRSYEKRIPNALFHCDDAKISLFLRHLWATDGNISWRRLPGRKPAATIYYASSSAGLTGDAQYLLLRLGIFASSRRIVSRKGYRDMYHLHVEGAANQLEFFSRIGCVGSRGLIVPELIQALKRIRQNPNRDAIPAEAWKKVIEPTKRQLGLSWREVCQRLEMSYCGSALFKNGISRNRMLRLAAILPSPEVRRLATSDVYWDQIVAITELGEEDVYDATVDGAHNFIADGFLVHNSIEQDADLVGLLVRPELYEEDEEARVEKAGEAELIIAKQRNGPVGEIPLTFLKEYTRFETRARNVSEPEEAF